VTIFETVKKPFTKEEKNTILIKEVLKRSSDIQNIFTPFELCDEVLDNINIDDSKQILVISNLEFILRIGKRLKNSPNGMNNVYFATPCATKLSVADALIPKENCIHIKELEKHRWDINSFMGKKFDVIVGNPPYDRVLYQKIVRMTLPMLVDTGEAAIIAPTAYIVGAKVTENYRQELINLGIHKIVFLSQNAFEGIDQTVTGIHYFNKNKSADIEFNFTFNSVKYSWSHERKSNNWVLYFDDIGKSIWNKIQKYHTKFKLDIESRDGKVVEAPCVAVNTIFSGITRVHLDGKLGKRQILSLSCDEKEEGAEKNKRNSHRFFFKEENSKNLHSYMTSKFFRILMLMCGFNYHVNKTNIGSLPYIALDGEYSDERIYDELGLSQEERDWIKSF
jgi:hypothetical protein